MTNKKSKRSDGWMNLLTGMGLASRDKRENTKISAPVIIDEQAANSLYRGDGFAKRIIDLPAGHMVREWFTVEGDPDGSIIKFLDSRYVKNRIKRALRWSRLYGGSMVVLGLDDGGDLDEELNEDNIRRLSFIKAVSRYRVTIRERETDTEKENYGDPVLYTISPVAGNPYDIHSSRVLLFDGSDVPERVRRQNNGWGDSILQSIYTRVRGLSSSYVNVEHVLDDFSMIVMTIDNLMELLAMGKEKLVQKRLNQMDLTRHIMNTVLLDSEEKFERSTSTVTGIKDLLDKLAEALSAVSGIPITLLMGRSPAGLNSTGEGDIRNYYDSISDLQEEILLPQLERLVYLVQKVKEGPTNGKELDDWSIKFNPLWQLTDKEIAETRNKNAESDVLYIDRGVLFAEEVAQSRFGGDTYSNDIVLSDDRDFNVNKMTDDDLEDDNADTNMPE